MSGEVQDGCRDAREVERRLTPVELVEYMLEGHEHMRRVEMDLLYFLQNQKVTGLKCSIHNILLMLIFC